MADELITKKITEVQNFSNGDLGTIIQVQGDEIGQTDVSTLKQDITNSVVSELTGTGSVSLNLVNLKGVVPTYADLALITPTPQLNDAYQVEADGLVYVYTENGFQSEGDGFVVQPEPIGVVEEGNTQAVSGGEVFEKTIVKSQIEKGNLIQDVVDGYINTSGALASLVGTRSVLMADVNEDSQYEIGGFIAGNSKNLWFYDENNDPIGDNIILNQEPLRVTSPSGARYVSFTVKVPADPDPENAYLRLINTDTIDPNKITDYQFIDFNFVNKKSIDIVDLSTLDQVQLFDKDSMIIIGRAINTSGVEVNDLGSACTDFIKIRENSSIYLKKITGSPTSSAFYDVDKNFISLIPMPSGGGFIKSPAGAVYFRANVYNSSMPDIEEGLNSFMVSISEIEIDYKPYEKFFASIEGIKIYQSPSDGLIENLELDNYILPFANYNYKKTIIEQGGNSLINIGLFGDSWTDSVPDAINYVKELTILLREKYGFGGAGWYDFANSQGSASTQKMGCANNEDADDIRTGPITYVDGTSNALGINLAHALFGDGSSITLNILKPHQTARIYYYGGGSYGNFTYKIGSGSVVNVDTSTTVGLQYIGISLNNTIESIEFNVTGNVILFGVDLRRNSGIRIHKFGNRGILANNYMNVNRDNLISWITSFNLDSATLLIGTNDRTLNRTPTQFKEYMEYFYSLYYEALPYSELGFISPSNNRLTAPLFPMIDYVRVIRDISVKNNIPFLNLIPLFGSTEKIINKGTFYDNVHPTVNGGVMIANYIQEKLFN